MGALNDKRHFLDGDLAAEADGERAVRLGSYFAAGAERGKQVDSAVAVGDFHDLNGTVFLFVIHKDAGLCDSVVDANGSIQQQTFHLGRGFKIEIQRNGGCFGNVGTGGGFQHNAFESFITG